MSLHADVILQDKNGSPNYILFKTAFRQDSISITANIPVFLQTRMNKVLLAALLTSFQSNGGSSLRAYDCTHADIEFQNINLAEPAHCPDPELDYDAVEKVHIKVIQATHTVPIKAFQCKLVVSKLITKCVWDRDVTGPSHWPLWNAVINIHKDDCADAIRDGVINYEGHPISFRMGELREEEWYSHGSLDRLGNCEYEKTIVSEGLTYAWSFQNIKVRFMAQEIRGQHDVISNQVTFPLMEITAHYDTWAFTDHKAGTVIWLSSPYDCHQAVSQVYKDAAWAYKYTKNHGRMENAIILINSTNSNQYAGLVIKATTQICSESCYTTHIHGLVVCPFVANDHSYEDGKFRPGGETQEINWQSQAGYLHLTTNLHLHDAFRQTQAAICAVDRKTLSNKLQAIAGETTPYALLDLYGPGYRSYIAGGVSYIAKCVPVDVVLSTHQNCTQQTPVRYNDQQVFLDPINLILQDFPTIIPCSDVMQVKWKIDDEWFCANPSMHKCETPFTLQPLAPSSMEVSFTTGMGHGIYTDEQLAAHKRYDAQVNIRTASLADLAENIVIQTHDGVIGSYLGPIDYKKVEIKIGPQIFPLVYQMGNVWHYMTGIGMIWIMIKIIVGFIIRFYGLYKRRGFGWWLLGAFTDTTFMMAAFPVSIMTNIFGRNEKPEDPGTNENIAMSNLASPATTMPPPMPILTRTASIKNTAQYKMWQPSLENDILDRYPGLSSQVMVCAEELTSAADRLRDSRLAGPRHPYNIHPRLTDFTADTEDSEDDTKSLPP